MLTRRRFAILTALGGAALVRQPVSADDSATPKFLMFDAKG